MINLTIAGQVYPYPINNDNPPWGAQATDWAEAVTAALSSIIGPGYISDSSFLIGNGVVSATPISGLSFNTALVRAAIVEYSVYRYTTSPNQDLVEVGTMYLSYKSSGWDIAIVGGQGAGVTFTITSGGQVQYTSSTMTGTYGALSVMKFRARTFLQ